MALRAHCSWCACWAWGHTSSTVTHTGESNGHTATHVGDLNGRTTQCCRHAIMSLMVPGRNTQWLGSVGTVLSKHPLIRCHPFSRQLGGRRSLLVGTATGVMADTSTCDLPNSTPLPQPFKLFPRHTSSQPQIPRQSGVFVATAVGRTAPGVMLVVVAG